MTTCTRRTAYIYLIRHHSLSFQNKAVQSRTPTPRMESTNHELSNDSMSESASRLACASVSTCASGGTYASGGDILPQVGDRQSRGDNELTETTGFDPSNLINNWAELTIANGAMPDVAGSNLHDNLLDLPINGSYSYVKFFFVIGICSFFFSNFNLKVTIKNDFQLCMMSQSRYVY